MKVWRVNGRGVDSVSSARRNMSILDSDLDARSDWIFGFLK